MGESLFRRPKIITKGLVSNLPDAININIEDLDIGMFIYIKDINIEGCEFLAPPNSVVVGVKTARTAIEVEEEDNEDSDDSSDTSSEAPSEAPSDASKEESPSAE